MIIKSKHFKNYTVVDNAILRDKNLSLKAKGLFCILSSLPSNWNVIQSQLEQFSNDGMSATTSAFKELIEYGIVKVTSKCDSKSAKFRGNLSYIVYPSLQLASNSNQEAIENELTDENIDTSTENALLENPIMEKAIMHKPSVLNKDIQSTDITNNNNDKLNYKSFMDLYYNFFKELNGFPPKINATEGKAMKGIIEYLIQCSENSDKALKAFEYVLSHWKDLSEFTQRRMRLCDINSNMVNILVELKQVKSKPASVSGNINKNYESTLQKLINQKSNG